MTEVGKPHFAVFELAEPVAVTEGTVLRVTLEFKHGECSTSVGLLPPVGGVRRESRQAVRRRGRLGAFRGRHAGSGAGEGRQWLA